MKVKLTNFGIYRFAEYELSDFTIICGKNNSGKTYVTYALYGFFDFFRQGYLIKINNKKIDTLIQTGKCSIEIDYSQKKINEYLSDACKQFTTFLPKIFASQSDTFKGSSVAISIDEDEVVKPSAFVNKYKFGRNCYLHIELSEKTSNLNINLFVDDADKDDLSDFVLRKSINTIIGDALKQLLFAKIIPECYLSSTERSGIVTFQSELNFEKNSILKEIVSQDNFSLNNLLNTIYNISYPLPVRRNIDFIRNLSSIANNESLIKKEHNVIIQAFNNITGGKYITRKDGMYFQPNKSVKKLSMNESASSVRSLLDIYFYLNCIAKPGQLLMIDEPELNLHPGAQCQMAKVLAMLVNCGVKVFITTHSDYIVKEINTLLMLNSKKEEKQIALMKQYHYNTDELLESDKVKLFISQIDSILIPGMNRKSRCQTIVEAPKSREIGIMAESFDDIINEMNKIQESLYFM